MNTITGPHNRTRKPLVIVAQEAFGVTEQKISFTGIRNLIVTQKIIDECEQKTRFAGIIGMDLPVFRDISYPSHEITRCKKILYVRIEIPSAENKTGIISSCRGAPA